ncbi:hydrogenase nickel insertion protein HypA [Thermoanaerobacterium thermosaccharolyticum DSM 571]|uniref:Hydrogenase maturation factor HypA n=1 Tax=Thermoanaerobacterium thermosaccharolyticum (strain ATCC 7956 / DSM 571 / NCIMB 9385 / NCA 3814 / NCTC 13789 / WDCM 00135 / 2032) TaxID=580327 RepID=D9TNX4_THETC|nr:hydrogenase maturation nickel metallochaperone HypA [Thermoanaerobacterium thermosaccharolyticum]ADL67712.1 hydrogenase nickel insertion protein HypA [Thermoanaerobacterium thermosaccharolyticum DSM 571]MCP2240475.1 hydrogenase nickel incorporation protein HypA/HybF [Thermoanaerobacterium thermosaccharolyticum]
MHELSITESIVNMVSDEVKKRNINKVTKINIVLGELTGFEEDSIKFYFDVLSEGTPLYGAILNFKRVKAEFKCRNCGMIYNRENFTFKCPYCGSSGVLIEKGKELYIDSIDVE